MDCSRSSSGIQSNYRRKRCSFAPERFQDALESLTVTEGYLQTLFDREGGLEELKKSLKASGAITNSLARQGIHFYLKRHSDLHKENEGLE
jgi:hypothetical protein